jgi:hypothetical protein
VSTARAALEAWRVSAHHPTFLALVGCRLSSHPHQRYAPDRFASFNLISAQIVLDADVNSI